MRLARAVAQPDGVDLVPAGHVLRVDVELHPVGLEARLEADLRHTVRAAHRRRILALPHLHLGAVQPEHGHADDGARVVRLVDENSRRHHRLGIFQQQPFVLAIGRLRGPGGLEVAGVLRVRLAGRLLGAPAALVAGVGLEVAPDVPVRLDPDPVAFGKALTEIVFALAIDPEGKLAVAGGNRGVEF